MKVPKSRALDSYELVARVVPFRHIKTCCVSTFLHNCNHKKEGENQKKQDVQLKMRHGNKCMCIKKNGSIYLYDPVAFSSSIVSIW